MSVDRALPFAIFSAFVALLLATGMAGAQAGETEASPSSKIDAADNLGVNAAIDQLPTLAAAENIVKDAETGIASWYGNTFHRQRTASGETFDAKAMTAAHPTLPFGTWVQVTLLSTGRSVVVRVTDRGPHIANRLIDISRAAAAKIGLVQRGAGEVVIETVAQPPKIR